jgi:hypothetical protein
LIVISTEARNLPSRHFAMVPCLAEQNPESEESFNREALRARAKNGL